MIAGVPLRATGLMYVLTWGMNKKPWTGERKK